MHIHENTPLISEILLDLIREKRGCSNWSQRGCFQNYHQIVLLAKATNNSIRRWKHCTAKYLGRLGLLGPTHAGHAPIPRLGLSQHTLVMPPFQSLYMSWLHPMVLTTPPWPYHLYSAKVRYNNGNQMMSQQGTLPKLATSKFCFCEFLNSINHIN